MKGKIRLPLNPIKAMWIDGAGAIFYSFCFPASGISGGVTILGVGEQTGYCSSVFLSIFSSYDKTDVGETCCRICLERLTSEMPGPARC